MLGLFFENEVVRCFDVEECTNDMAVHKRTLVYEPFHHMYRRWAHECAKALEQTHAMLGFLRSQCVLTLELNH